MADNPLAPAWVPSQVQTTAKWGKYLIWGGLVIGGVWLFNGFAPSVVQAQVLLYEILTNSTKLIEAGAGFLIAVFLFHEVFFKSGHINKLLNMWYLSAINSAVRQVITIDPLTPIDERITSLQRDQANFEANAARVDSVLSSIGNKRDEATRKAADAARHIAAARNAGASAANALQSYSNQYGAYTKASQDYDSMYQRLLPISGVLKQVSQAIANTLDKLKLDRGLLKDKWALQEAAHGAADSAGKLLGRSKDETWNLADQAEDVINSKYGEELGYLEHMKSYADPLLESISLDNATYSEEALQQVTVSGQKMIQSTAATPMPSGASLAMPQSGTDFSDFMR